MLPPHWDSGVWRRILLSSSNRICTVDTMLWSQVSSSRKQGDVFVGGGLLRSGWDGNNCIPLTFTDGDEVRKEAETHTWINTTNRGSPWKMNIQHIVLFILWSWIRVVNVELPFYVPQNFGRITKSEVTTALASSWNSPIWCQSYFPRSKKSHACSASWLCFLLGS